MAQKVKHEVWKYGYMVFNYDKDDPIGESNAWHAAYLANKAILKMMGES